MWEGSVAANAIGHWIVVVRSEGVTRRVIAEVVLVLEITIAGLAVMGGAAVYVVLLPLDVACKVAIAVIAWPVDIGSDFVLLEVEVVWEGSVAANTIDHWMVVIRSEEVTRRERTITVFIQIGRSFHHRDIHARCQSGLMLQ